MILLVLLFSRRRTRNIYKRQQKQGLLSVLVIVVVVISLVGFFGYRKYRHQVNTNASVADGSDSATCGQRYQGLQIISCLDHSAQAETTRFYLGLFRRSPSPDELKSVSTQIMGGQNLTNIASSLMKNNATEFNKYYTVNSSNATFVGELYKNVLQRAPDTNALKLHISQLDKKQQTRAQLVVYFTQSEENITKTRVTMWCVVANFGCSSTGGGTTGKTTSGTIDPVTGYTEPSDSNTGYKAAGLTLANLTDASSLCNSNTAYSIGHGTYVEVTATHTFTAINLPCGVYVSANNVVIQNSYISSNASYGVYITKPSYTGTTIKKTTLFGNNNSNNDSAVSSQNFTITDSNVYGWVDGFKANSNVTIEHNWIHDFNSGNGNHNDGVQISYTGNIQVLGNKFEARSAGESGGISSTVYTNQDYGVKPNNVVVKGNWINAGGYFIRVDATNFKIENNRFGTWYGYGILTVAPQSTWTQSGNVMDATGAPVKL